MKILKEFWNGLKMPASSVVVMLPEVLTLDDNSSEALADELDKNLEE